VPVFGYRVEKIRLVEPGAAAQNADNVAPFVMHGHRDHEHQCADHPALDRNGHRGLVIAQRVLKILPAPVVETEAACRTRDVGDRPTLRIDRPDAGVEQAVKNEVLVKLVLQCVRRGETSAGDARRDEFQCFDAVVDFLVDCPGNVGNG